jgi:dTDP-4-dehydrorhamnose reductase
VSSILVIGRTGQLALSLAERAAAQGVPLAFAGRPEADLAEPESLRRIVAESGASFIINAAAYTAVDRAEDEPDAARAANAVAPGVLASAAKEVGARLIHVSTDYVFDGSGDRPWREDDPVGPAGVYGRTKLEGEQAVREALPEHVIVRTAWVYSPFGANFVKTMLNAARTRPELQVVEDQVGNPTSALDLADGLLAILLAWARDPSRGLGATNHLAGTGSTSWADFAREIFALSRARGGPSAEVRGIASAEWPAKAPRPLNSRLDSARFAETFGYRAPPWQDSLAPVIDRLLAAA